MADTSPYPRRRRLVILGLAALLVAAGCSSDDGAVDTADAGDASVTLDPNVVRSAEPALDAVVERIMGATDVPGVAVGVVLGDEVVLTKGYGVRKAGTDSAVDAETVFQVASLSKPIGATAVAGVVGRGDLAWDQPVITELPDFRLSDPYVTDNATVADFYSHRTGLPGETAGNDLEQIGYDQATIVERLAELPLAPFRATYSYSNFGLTVGGLAAAAAYGAPFADMAEEVLFTPAGMTATTFRHDDLANEDNVALLHARVDGTFEARFTRDADAQAPAGGASSNVVDLSRWMVLQLNEGRLDGEQIIDAEALSETKRPFIRKNATSDPAAFTSEYGLGWDIGPSSVGPEPLEWSHSGAFTAGAGTTVRLLPTYGLGVVVLTNAQPVGAAEAIADEIVDIVLNGEATLDWFNDGWGPVFASLFAPTEPPALPAPAPARPVSAYVGTYANAYLGDVVVREGTDGLELAWGPGGVRVVALEPFDGDTFLIDLSPELPGSRTPVVFEFPDGTSTAASLQPLLVPSPLPWLIATRVAS